MWPVVKNILQTRQPVCKNMLEGSWCLSCASAVQEDRIETAWKIKVCISSGRPLESFTSQEPSSRVHCGDQNLRSIFQDKPGRNTDLSRCCSLSPFCAASGSSTILRFYWQQVTWSCACQRVFSREGVQSGFHHSNRHKDNYGSGTCLFRRPDLV